MRAIILFVFLVVSSFSLNAQNWQWTHFGANAECSQMATDNQGNVYMAGGLYDTVYIGNTMLVDTSFGIFLTKLNPTGSIQWVKQLEGVSNISKILIDHDENLLLFGYANDTIIITGDTTLYGGSGSDIILAKFTPAGNLIWGKMYMARSWHDPVIGLAIDAQNNIYITGGLAFGNTARFGNLSFNRTGESDLFILKTDENGNELWLEHIGDIDVFTYGSDLRVAGNDLYLVGYTDSIAHFDNISFSTGTFLAKYDLSGTAQWVEPFVGDQFFEGYVFDILDSGRVAGITGFDDSLTVGSTTVHAGAGNSGLALIQYSSAGIIENAQVLGYSNDINFWVSNLATDADHNIYITGVYDGTTTFDTLVINPIASREYFAAKFDKTGHRVWTGSLVGGTITAMAINSTGTLFVAGQADSVSFRKVQNDIVYNMFVATADNPNIFSNVPDIVNGEVLVYPNPTSGLLTVKCTDMGNAGFTLYDLTGREWINEQNLYGNEVTIDGSNLPDGMYFYRLMDNGALIGCGKVVVAH